MKLANQEISSDFELGQGFPVRIANARFISTIHDFIN
jgi:hypothetical protein